MHQRMNTTTISLTFVDSQKMLMAGGALLLKNQGLGSMRTGKSMSPWMVCMLFARKKLS